MTNDAYDDADRPDDQEAPEDAVRVIVRTILVRETMTTYTRLEDVVAETEAWTRATFDGVEGLFAFKVDSLSMATDYEHRMDEDVGMAL